MYAETRPADSDQRERVRAGSGRREPWGSGIVYRRGRRWYAQYYIRGVKIYIRGSFATEPDARKAAREARLAAVGPRGRN